MSGPKVQQRVGNWHAMALRSTGTDDLVGALCVHHAESCSFQNVNSDQHKNDTVDLVY